MDHSSQPRNIDVLLARYAESHRNHTNEIIHFVCIPLIVLSLLGILWAIHPVVAIATTLASLYYSFTNYDLLTPPQWTGLANYKYAFLNDDRLRSAVVVTFTYVFWSVPLKLAAALGLAMILDRSVRGVGVYRSIFYLPSLLGASVAIAVLWRQIFGDQFPAYG